MTFEAVFVAFDRSKKNHLPNRTRIIQRGIGGVVYHYTMSRIVLCQSTAHLTLGNILVTDTAVIIVLLGVAIMTPWLAGPFIQVRDERSIQRLLTLITAEAVSMPEFAVGFCPCTCPLSWNELLTFDAIAPLILGIALSTDEIFFTREKVGIIFERRAAVMAVVTGVTILSALSCHKVSNNVFPASEAWIRIETILVRAMLTEILVLLTIFSVKNYVRLHRDVFLALITAKAANMEYVTLSIHELIARLSWLVTHVANAHL